MVESERNDKVCRVLSRIGYGKGTKIATSLQGSIWRASQTSTNSNSDETVIFKITNRSLHQHSHGTADGKLYHVKENILMEQSILKYLTQQRNCPKSIVKWKAFFKTNTHYWLAMEDGGLSLFDFIQTSHVLISRDKLDINEWKKAVKIIFKQMVECVDFLHSNNVCHNDISLENFLVNDVDITVDQESLKIRFCGDIEIKLCDFGVAKLFTSNNCISNNHCGKPRYKSPEVINNKRGYDAKANDTWCLGICLFAMSTGFIPWDQAHMSHDAFKLAMDGYLVDLMNLWDCVRYVDRDLIHLFQCVFQYEETRITLDKMKEHLS